MSIPIKGDDAIDESALQKIKETCRYLMENLKQFSQDTLMGLLAQFDETEVHLKTALDWRVKQSLGGTYVARLTERIDELDQRMASIEQKLDVFLPNQTLVETEPDEKQIIETSGEVEASQETK